MADPAAHPAAVPDPSSTPAADETPPSQAHQLVTSDPVRIRALAHPLRLRLLDLLDDHGPATATRCAELTGESVASCSFHLRTLARHGFVEPAERAGREKPWRVVGQGRRTRWDPEAPGSLRAVTELARTMAEREAERISDWLTRTSTMPAEWLDASTMTQATFWATAEEMAELSAEIEGLAARFAGRSQDPALRPEGAQVAYLWAVAHGDPERPTATAASDSPAPPGLERRRP